MNFYVKDGRIYRQEMTPDKYLVNGQSDLPDPSNFEPGTIAYTVGMGNKWYVTPAGTWEAAAGNTVEVTDITLTPMDASATVWGHTISDLQTGLFIGDSKITGTLAYVTTGTLATDWGAGNFMAIQFGGDAFDDAEHIWVGMDPSQGSGLVDVKPDPEKSGVFKVTNKLQKFKVVVEYATRKETLVYDLSGLTLATE